jgi:hypothetical protein
VSTRNSAPHPRIHDEEDKTAVGFSDRRVLLSQPFSKQDISGVPGFEPCSVYSRGKFRTQFIIFYAVLESAGKWRQQFGHGVRNLGD